MPALLWEDAVPPSAAACACAPWLKAIESCAHQTKFGSRDALGAWLTRAYVGFSFSIAMYLHLTGWLVAAVLVARAVSSKAAVWHVPRWVGPTWKANEIAWTAVIVTQVLKRAYPDEARPAGAERCTSSSGFPSGHACISAALLVALLLHAAATRAHHKQQEEARQKRKQRRSSMLAHEVVGVEDGEEGVAEGAEEDVPMYVLLGGALLLPVAPSRLALRYHTVPQVRAGLVLGAALGAGWHVASLWWRRASANAGSSCSGSASDRSGGGSGVDLPRVSLAVRSQCHVGLVATAHALGAWYGAPLYWFAAPDIAAAAVLGGMAINGSVAQWTPKPKPSASKSA